MSFDDDTDFDDANPPEESSNRTFLLAAGLLGGLVFLGLLCIAGYFFFRNIRTNKMKQLYRRKTPNNAATIQAGVTQTAVAQALTQTAAVTNTVPPTNTPVIAAATATSTATTNPATVTISAGLTIVAGSTQTMIPTSTALPNTGFADDIGAPGLIAIAIALVLVIFLVRRLRASPSK